ncbi:glycogen debranching enzyme [Thermosporothrix hazakensis]|jgi:glycogen debranching enzyme|uniref:Glycogen debranching enzyme n=1 Tax=Thermosporothrix hazakensis TaxID=644383 RepID=A0A326U1U8_THEHA|nr:trehalase family glycosidase [Thermosporothrix hazakensis]PZW25284.1 glycogen debranching enzyme [Thermosporothrix hazakensis]GCE50516.1 glycoside hydrolase family 37 [Thermosporothrix hazakensis]
MLTYNLHAIYFSVPDSFLTLKANASGNRLIYSTSARKAMSEKWQSYWASNFFEIELFEQDSVLPYIWIAYPHRLELHTATGADATFTFADPQTLIFEAHGCDVRFVPCKPYKAHYQTPDGVLNLVDTGTQYVHQFRPGPETQLTAPVVGTITFQRRENITHGAFRLVPHETFWNGMPSIDVEAAANIYATQFNRWRERLPAVPDHYQETAEKALFLLWNCQVPVEGYLTRRAIFSSKAAMNGVWSWDNCFHALALADIDPELAWEQLFLVFDHQAENGVLPDVIHDSKVLYGYTKPPIYGWTIRKLIQMLGVEASLPALTRLYVPLCRLTEWWYRQRGTSSGMCCYYDGNDSGWDNATVFDSGLPIEGVDLAAYLVLQMETLALMAELLGRAAEAQDWQQRAQQQLAVLLTTGLQENRFLSRTASGERVTPHSLLNYVPLLLGKRLPSSVLATMKADLQPGGPFLTPYGLASESPTSPAYTADGYWRGPIWAPPTYLIVDGLVDAGELELARLLARRYCDMVARDATFYENYDALTGQGLRCPGICWTAAVFLRLAIWLHRCPQE